MGFDKSIIKDMEYDPSRDRYVGKDGGELKVSLYSYGTVHRYEYIKPDDIRAGHGHSSYKSMDDYLKDEKARILRDKRAPESKGR